MIAEIATLIELTSPSRLRHRSTPLPISRPTGSQSGGFFATLCQFIDPPSIGAGGFHFYDHSWVSGPRHPTAPAQCLRRRRRRLSDVAAKQVYQKHGFALQLRLSDRVHVHLMADW